MHTYIETSVWLSSRCARDGSGKFPDDTRGMKSQSTCLVSFDKWIIFQGVKVLL